ncbi:hypothetical protein GCM10018793_05840 [Streptomyces sulfonofaciens]|uniref:PE-PGRS family protein n=1 Tax=Streptomyces sulfonofaciens TaxID=68272 RepID=A0A919FS63_9ACTN|nr:hypothetical protein GCM10018793_05840 [Streptomyces sulfonofaciens]
MVAHEDSPVAALADAEAWEARERYPELMSGGGPLFAVAQELESGGWELLTRADATPQGARDAMAMVFRERAHHAGPAGDTAARDGLLAAAELLDRERHDELAVHGVRHRIVRAEPFIRMGPSGPEPPRPTDPDPAAAGRSHEVPNPTRGFVIDPFAGTGPSESILRLELLALVRKAGTVPLDVHRDSRHAAHTHPGGVLLPAEFMIAEYADGRWQPTAGPSSTPQGARDSLAMYLRVLAPVLERLDDTGRAAYARLADRLDAERRDEVEIAGRPTRVVRVERLVRIGPDGPEGPRPSDPDPDPPTALGAEQLRERGVRIDDDAPYDPSPAARELARLFDEERRRKDGPAGDPA